MILKNVFSFFPTSKENPFISIKWKVNKYRQQTVINTCNNICVVYLFLCMGGWKLSLTELLRKLYTKTCLSVKKQYFRNSLIFKDLGSWVSKMWHNLFILFLVSKMLSILMDVNILTNSKESIFFFVLENYVICTT